MPSMPRRRFPVTEVAFTVWFAVFVTWTGTACGPSARVQALTTTLKSVDAARAAFVAWDDAAQTRIVDEAASLDEGRAKLATHRAKRDRLTSYFELAYRAIAAALAVEDGDTFEVIGAVSSLWTAYEKTIGQPPPGPGGK